LEKLKAWAATIIMLAISQSDPDFDSDFEPDENKQ
jgi:hypothetical protein